MPADTGVMLADIASVAASLEGGRLDPLGALREAERLSAAFSHVEDAEASRRLAILLSRLDDFAYPHMSEEWVQKNLLRATETALRGKEPRPARITYILDTSAASGNLVVLEAGGRQVAVASSGASTTAVEQAAKWFWFEGHVAMWVDLHLRSCTSEEAVIALLRSRAFIRPSARIMHRREGYPPFHR